MLTCHARFKQSARRPDPGPSPEARSGPDLAPEAQVADARAGMTPADMVRHRLSVLLQAAPRAMGRAESGSALDCGGMDREAPVPGLLAGQRQRFDR
jgi:hypothetical protein